jgi:hypothetical protein
MDSHPSLHLFYEAGNLRIGEVFPFWYFTAYHFSFDSVTTNYYSNKPWSDLQEKMTSELSHMVLFCCCFVYDKRTIERSCVSNCLSVSSETFKMVSII